jgi:hypothetical protein
VASDVSSAGPPLVPAEVVGSGCRALSVSAGRSRKAVMEQKLITPYHMFFLSAPVLCRRINQSWTAIRPVHAIGKLDRDEIKLSRKVADVTTEEVVA